MTPTLRLAEALIARVSVTPDDAGCQNLIAQRLAALGFNCQTIESGPGDFRVTNLWAKRTVSPKAPTLVFAGHTDVVPTGPVEQWDSDPFMPTHRDGKLFGRGASDMKTSLAAMVVACEEFVATHPKAPLNVAFLLTSDEEGPANDGTVVVCPPDRVLTVSDVATVTELPVLAQIPMHPDVARRVDAGLLRSRLPRIIHVPLAALLSKTTHS